MFSYKVVSSAAWRLLMLSGVCLALSFASCKKEYEKAPYANMESFTLTLSSGSVLEGSIVDGEILLYWPYEEELPATVTPEIRISDHASMSPAAGTAVSFTNETKFTVTAQDGTQAVYALHIVDNQPIPFISRLNYHSAYNGMKVVRGADFMNQVIGYYFVKDTDKTKVFLRMEKTGEELPIGISSIFVTSITMNPLSTVRTFAYGDAYRIKIISGIHTILSDDVLTFGTPTPIADRPSAPQTAKRGETIVITGTNLQSVYAAKMNSTSSSANAKDVEVVSASSTTVTLRIPASLATGSYRYFFLTYQDDYTASTSLSVNAAAANAVTVTE